MTARDDLQVLTGAYAIDALTGEELVRFERYLAGSEDARTEVVGMTETAVLLGSIAAPVVPSAQLKQTLMGLIATTPQLPSLADSAIFEGGASESVGDAGANREGRGTEGDGDEGGDGTVAGHSFKPVPLRSQAQSKVQSRWFARPTVMIAAAAAAAAIFFGGNVVVTSLQQAESIRVQAGTLAALSSAADLQTKVQPVAGGGSATLLWSGDLRRSALVISELPALDLSKTYEAWYINAQGAKSAGTFNASGERTGKTWHVLDGAMTAADAVGVTVEPAGGSRQPTTKPIVAMPTP